jgi:hypothetical protein
MLKMSTTLKTVILNFLYILCNSVKFLGVGVGNSLLNVVFQFIQASWDTGINSLIEKSHREILVNTPCLHLHSFCTNVSSSPGNRVILTRILLERLGESITWGVEIHCVLWSERQMISFTNEWRANKILWMFSTIQFRPGIPNQCAMKFQPCCEISESNYIFNCKIKYV